MKTILPLCLLFVISTSNLFSQSPELVVKSNDKGLYLDHKVAAKENFYSIGRLYNISAKEIEAFNKLDMNKGLNLGQMIKIPLTAANFSQSVNQGTPVYFVTDEKETVAKVAAANKLSSEKLKQWNSINGDNVKADTKLIIGFLQSKEMASVTINEIKQPVVENKKTEEKITKTEPVVEKAKPVEEKPKLEEKVVVTPPVEEKKAPVTIVPKENPVNSEKGYFKTSFDSQVKSSPVSKNEMVTAGIFKTASGWQDGKYYLLINKVQPGTIVKVVNPDNNKEVYAKVLGEMSGIRQNEGLNIRISNSAANALQVTDQDKFIVKVNY